MAASCLPHLTTWCVKSSNRLVTEALHAWIFFLKKKNSAWILNQQHSALLYNWLIYMRCYSRHSRKLFPLLRISFQSSPLLSRAIDFQLSFLCHGSFWKREREGGREREKMDPTGTNSTYVYSVIGLGFALRYTSILQIIFWNQFAAWPHICHRITLHRPMFLRLDISEWVNFCSHSPQLWPCCLQNFELSPPLRK